MQSKTSLLLRNVKYTKIMSTLTSRTVITLLSVTFVLLPYFRISRILSVIRDIFNDSALGGYATLAKQVEGRDFYAIPALKESKKLHLVNDSKLRR